MSLATCCCGSACKTPYNCDQAGTIEPDFVEFEYEDGLLVPDQWFDGSSVRPVKGIEINFDSPSTEARLISTNVAFVDGVTQFTSVQWNFEIDISYTAELESTFGGCRCTSDSTDAPDFEGIMNFSGAVYYSCCDVRSTGEPCSDSEQWSWINTSGSGSDGRRYNMAPDATGCSAFTSTTFESLLIKKPGSTDTSLRGINSCSGLLSVTNLFELELRIPNGNSNCLTEAFDSTADRNTFILEVGFDTP